MTFTKLSAKQKQVFRWCYQPGSYALICDGSVRSGKTASMACSFILWAMSSFQNARFAICGNTVQSAERNIVMELEQMVDVAHYFQLRYLGSKHILTVTGNGTTNRFHIFGGKDEASYKLVQGLTLSGVLFDEVALMPESFVNQAIARSLSVDGAKLWFNCNPDSPEHWFYKQWVQKCDEGQRSDTRHIHFRMEDNPVMTLEKIRRAQSMFSGVFYRRYILGEWCVAEGLVYPMFDKEKHVVHELPDKQNCDFFISCDYGTVNPTSMGLWALNRYTGKATRIREYYWNSRETGARRTDEEHYTELVRLAGELADQLQYVLVDPSAASFIECIRRHQRFRVRQADNAVLDGIRDTATLLNLGYLQFHESCGDCIREFGLYCWDEKAQTDAVIKENDHAMDDTRYFVRTAMRQTLREIRMEGS